MLQAVEEAAPAVHPHSRGVYDRNLQSLKRETRFIPTRVGYTRSTTGGRLWRTVHPHSRGVYGMVRSRGGGSTAVHPHSRGVYKTTGLELIDDCGSSPLAWGIRQAPTPARRTPRFIPTRVGYTGSGL